MTSVPLKDLPDELPPPAAAYKAALPPGRIVGFPLSALDRLSVPAWSTTFWDEAGGKWLGVIPNGIGYGATDADALVGAFGEMTEMVHLSVALQEIERRRASYRDLVNRFGVRSVADPLTCCLPAGSPVDRDTVLEWVPARRWPTRETVWLPIDIAAYSNTDLSPGYEPFTTPITNGMGAGPTLDWALAHGIQELLQRDGNGLLFRSLDQGVVIDTSDIADPTTRALLDRYESEGVEVLPKFATDEFGITNLYVVGADREDRSGAPPIMMTACGEAAAPNRDRALRKALLEFGAARVRKAFSHGPLDMVERIAPPNYLARFRERHSLEGEESRALQAMLHWLSLDRAGLRDLLKDTVLSRRATKKFAELPTWDPPASEERPGAALCATLTERLTAAGLDVLYIDASPANAADLGVHAVKAFVPGLEVETMSYYRIGERNVRKLLDRGSDMIRRGKASASGLQVRLAPEAEERLGGPVWLDPAAVDRTVGKLYPLYREPEIHSAPIAMEARVAVAARGGTV
ncbi:MAG TPA: YcaO-like family protein [Stellaceae bacterium]